MEDKELQYRLLYSTAVAGKTYKFAESVMERFVRLMVSLEHETLFQTINEYIKADIVSELVRFLRTGSYTRIEKCWTEVVKLDLHTCTVKELEAIHGIGPKTARFFILWTRDGARVAALDVHILKWLRQEGYDAPKATPPSGKRYDELERAFLEEADKRNMTPRDLDAQIWEQFSGYKEKQNDLV